MALMSLDEIKTKMLNETPVQWCVYLEMIEVRLNQTPFKTLREFVTTPINKGGIGIPIERAKELLDFNPAYAHKAKKLKATLGLAAAAETIPAVKDVGANQYGDYNSENVMSSEQQGNASTYRIAKLKRDHPDIIEWMIAGEFRNVADAERAAGTRPPLRPKVKLALPLDNRQEAIDIFNEWLSDSYPV